VNKQETLNTLKGELTGGAKRPVTI